MKVKILLTILAAFCFANAISQNRKSKFMPYNRSSDKGNTFLHKQWWIGIKGGVNVANPVVGSSYAVITPTNYDAALIQKKYEKFMPIGSQVALECSFYLRGFSISVQPGYHQTGLLYGNTFNWNDPEQTSMVVELSYEHAHRMEYLTLPLLLKYEIPVRRFSPYIQAGVYLNTLLNANKEITQSGNDESAGGPNHFETEPVSVGATDLFARHHYGIIGGVGICYTPGNVRINLDIQYRHALTLLNSPGNRYDNDRLAGVGDAMDDLKLNNVVISAGVLFPLRFLSSGFKSTANPN
jgi:hypothetical protein